jgi:ATP-binding cassette subfamily B protein
MKKNALRRITPYVRPYALLMGTAVAVSLIEIVAEAAIPQVTRKIIDGPIKSGQTRLLIPLGGVLVLLGLIMSSLARARRMWLARGSHGFETDFRNRLYAHLQQLHVSFHDSWQSGQLLSRAIYDINSLRRFIGFGAPFMIILGAEVLVIVGLMFSIDATLAAIVAIGILPVGWVSHTFGRKYRVLSRKVQDQQGDLATTIEESATGIRIIKAFGRAATMQKRFRERADLLRRTGLEGVKLNSRLWPLFEVSPSILLIAIVLFGGQTVVSNPARLSLGELVAFISYLMLLVWPVDALGWILAMSVEARTAAERIFEVLDTPAEIHDVQGATSLDYCVGRISLEGVSFRYSEERDWVLRDINLTVEPGETLALVGKTGSGKTTLAMLVPRLYNVTRGRITLDGDDIGKLSLESLRSHIGVAFEDPILFSASVKDNLLMGRPDASDDEIRSALSTAQAEFVYELPWGLETRVGEQGYTLSGGQRQRLALARAVLGKPRVLVLDDPLSSVDVHTEALIEEALESVLDGVTAILVVHRPSTLALADRVALLDEGRIVAVGSHHDLMEEHPLYRAVLSQEAEEFARSEVEDVHAG